MVVEEDVDPGLLQHCQSSNLGVTSAIFLIKRKEAQEDKTHKFIKSALRIRLARSIHQILNNPKAQRDPQRIQPRSDDLVHISLGEPAVPVRLEGGVGLGLAEVGRERPF